MDLQVCKEETKLGENRERIVKIPNSQNTRLSKLENCVMISERE